MTASRSTTCPLEDRFAALHALVLADPALQDALGDIETVAAFAARTAEAARARGLDLDGQAVEAWLHAPPLQPPPIADQPPLAGWLPAEVTQVAGRRALTWLRFGARRLTESFYADSLTLARHRPFNRLFSFRTPLDALEARAAMLPSLPPSGLIFHMSRCGSTLAAQMLAASPANIVVSEAAPLNAVVQMENLDETAKVALLRAMAAALGQVRAPGEARLFLKLDCWHTRDLPLFRRAFPDTPWVFLYRDPVEVMVSHLRRRGVQMVPSLVPPAILGIDLPGGVPDEDYCARVLAAVCEGALRRFPAGGGRLVNYRQMPDALVTRILPHFGAAVSDAEADLMRAAAIRDAKAPEQAFAPDTLAKQDAASRAVRAICARRLEAIHQALEAMRQAET
jgi:hypothetical protein